MSRLASKIVREFPLPLGEWEGERYWKDPGLQDVRFPILLEKGMQPGEMLCGILAAAWEIAGPWTVLSMGEAFTPGWEFIAIADHKNADIRIPGVEWMRISLLLHEAAS
jgi:hypothetical protein